MDSLFFVCYICDEVAILNNSKITMKLAQCIKLEGGRGGCNVPHHKNLCRKKSICDLLIF